MGWGWVVAQIVIAVVSYALAPKPKQRKESLQVQRQGVDQPLERLYGTRRMSMVITNAQTSKRILSPSDSKVTGSANAPDVYVNFTHSNQTDYTKSDVLGALHVQGPICVVGRENAEFSNQFVNLQEIDVNNGADEADVVLVNELPYYDKALKSFQKRLQYGGTAHALWLSGGKRDGWAELIDSFGVETDQWTNCIHASALAWQKISEHDSIVFQGLPEWSFRLRSNNLYDPRTDGFDVYNPSAWTGRSDNPALQLLDYLLDPIFGAGVPSDEINFSSFQEMARIADIPIAIRSDKTFVKEVPQVTTSDFNFTVLNIPVANYIQALQLLGYTQEQIDDKVRIQQAGYQATVSQETSIRYLMESNITLDTNDPLNENIEQLLSALRGARLFKEPKGKWKILPAWIVEEDITQEITGQTGVGPFKQNFAVDQAFITVKKNGTPITIASQQLEDASGGLDTIFIQKESATWNSNTNTLVINFAEGNTPDAIIGNQYTLVNFGVGSSSKIIFVPQSGNPVVNYTLGTWTITPPIIQQAPSTNQNYGRSYYSLRTHSQIPEFVQGITLQAGDALVPSDTLTIEYDPSVVPGIPISAHIISDPVDLGLNYDAIYDGEGDDQYQPTATNLPLIQIVDVSKSSFNSVSLDDKLNQCIIKFPDEDNFYKTNEVVWPETDSVKHVEFLAEDNDKPLVRTISSNSITNKALALDHAEFIVRQSRSSNSLAYNLSSTALMLEPNDIVKVTDPLLNLEDVGPSNRYWRVVEKKVNADATVDISFIQYETEDYTFVSDDYDDDRYQAVLDELPTATWAVPPFVRFPPGSSAGSGRLQWIAPETATISGYLVRMFSGPKWVINNIYSAGQAVFHIPTETVYVANVETSSEPSEVNSDWRALEDGFTKLGIAEGTSLVVYDLEYNKAYTFSVQVIVPTRGAGPAIYHTEALAQELAPPVDFSWESSDTTITISWHKGIFEDAIDWLGPVPGAPCKALVRGNDTGEAYRIYVREIGPVDQLPLVGEGLGAVRDLSFGAVPWAEDVNPTWLYDPAYTGGDPFDIASYNFLSLAPGPDTFEEALNQGIVIAPTVVFNGIEEIGTTGSNTFTLSGLPENTAYQVWVKEIYPYNENLYSLPGPLDPYDLPGYPSACGIGDPGFGLLVQTSFVRRFSATGYFSQDPPSDALWFSERDAWFKIVPDPVKFFILNLHVRNDSNTAWIDILNGGGNEVVYLIFMAYEATAWEDDRVVHVFFQEEEPIVSDITNYDNPAAGPEHKAFGQEDQWYDINDGNKRYYWDVPLQKWIPYNGDGITTSYIHNHFKSTEPVDGIDGHEPGNTFDVGDLWFDTDDIQGQFENQYQWTGSNWEDIPNTSTNYFYAAADNPLARDDGWTTTFFSNVRPFYDPRYDGSGDPFDISNYYVPAGLTFQQAVDQGYITAPVQPATGNGYGDILVVTELPVILYWWDGFIWRRGLSEDGFGSGSGGSIDAGVTRTYRQPEPPTEEDTYIPDPNCIPEPGTGACVSDPVSFYQSKIISDFSTEISTGVMKNEANEEIISQCGHIAYTNASINTNEFVTGNQSLEFSGNGTLNLVNQYGDRPAWYGEGMTIDMRVKFKTTPSAGNRVYFFYSGAINDNTYHRFALLNSGGSLVLELKIGTLNSTLSGVVDDTLTTASLSSFSIDPLDWNDYRVVFSARDQECYVYVNGTRLDTLSVSGLFSGHAYYTMSLPTTAFCTYYMSDGTGTNGINGYIDFINYTSSALSTEATYLIADFNVFRQPYSEVIHTIYLNSANFGFNLGWQQSTDKFWQPYADGWLFTRFDVIQGGSAPTNEGLVLIDEQEEFKTLIGNPSIEPPLLSDGIASIKITSGTDQGFLFHGNEVGQSFQTYVFVLKHDGSATTRTLLCLGNIGPSENHVRFLVELTSTHQIRCSVYDTNTSSRRYVTSTLTVPTDTVCSIIIAYDDYRFFYSSPRAVYLGINGESEELISPVDTAFTYPALSDKHIDNTLVVGGKYSGPAYPWSPTNTQKYEFFKLTNAGIVDGAVGVTFGLFMAFESYDSATTNFDAAAIYKAVLDTTTDLSLTTGLNSYVCGIKANSNVYHQRTLVQFEKQWDISEYETSDVMGWNLGYYPYEPIYWWDVQTASQDNTTSYTGINSVRVGGSSPIMKIEWGVGDYSTYPGGYTVEFSVKFNTLPTGIQAFFGEWAANNVNYSSYFAVEEISGSYYFRYVYDALTHTGGVANTWGDGSHPRVHTSSEIIGVNWAEWNRIRLTVSPVHQKIYFYLNGEFIDVIDFSADDGFMPNYNWSISGKFLGRVSDTSSTYAMDGWFDDFISWEIPIATTDGIEYDHLSTTKITGLPQYPIRDLLYFDIAGYTEYASNLDPSLLRYPSQLFILTYFFAFTEPANSISFANWGDVVQQVSDSVYQHRAVIGTPSAGEPGLTSTSIASVKFTSDTGQAYMVGDINEELSKHYEGAIFGIIKHDGTSKTRTLLFQGDKGYGNDLKGVYISIELDPTHHIKVGVPDPYSGAYNYTTSTVTIPVDTPSTFVIGVEYISLSEQRILIFINGQAAGVGSIYDFTTKSSYYGAGDWPYSVYFLCIGAKYDSGIIYNQGVNDYGEESIWRLSDATFTESAEGVTFDTIAIYREEPTLAMAQKWHESLTVTGNTGGGSGGSTTLISDIRYQGTVGEDSIIDLGGIFTWTAYNSEYSDSISNLNEGIYTSLYQAFGQPLVSSGWVECDDTQGLLDAIADGPFCFEIWEYVGYQPSLWNLHKGMFGLINDALNPYPVTFDTVKPYFGVMKYKHEDFNDSSDQVWALAHDENLNEIFKDYVPGNSVTDLIGSRIIEGFVDASDGSRPFTHLAFTREISGSDSIYRLFNNGALIYQYTDAGRIVDWSQLSAGDVANTKFIWGHFFRSASTGFPYVDMSRIWTETKYTTNFVPDRVVSTDSNCPLLLIPGINLNEGDRWIDTDDGDREYRWDGTQWVPLDQLSNPQSVSDGFQVKNRNFVAPITYTRIENWSDEILIGGQYFWNYQGVAGRVALVPGTYKVDITYKIVPGHEGVDVRLVGYAGGDTPATTPILGSEINTPVNQNNDFLLNFIFSPVDLNAYLELEIQSNPLSLPSSFTIGIPNTELSISTREAILPPLPVSGGDILNLDIYQYNSFDGSDGDLGNVAQNLDRGSSITTVGNTQLDNTQVKWGTTSMYFPGAVGDYLQFDTQRFYRLPFSDADYTIEFWIYPAANDTTKCLLQNYYAKNFSQYVAGVRFYYHTDQSVSYQVFDFNNVAKSDLLQSSASSVPLNTWSLITVEYTAATTSLKLLVDRVSEATGGFPSGLPATIFGRFMYFGSEAAGVDSFQGWLDDLRITMANRNTEGLPLPTSAFDITPPSSPSGDPLWDNVVVMLPGGYPNGTVAANTVAGYVYPNYSGSWSVYDSSQSKFASTSINIAATTSFSTQVALGSTWTMETWFRTININDYIWQTPSDSTLTYFSAVRIDSGPTLLFFYSGSGFTTPVSINFNQWYYIRTTYDGTDFKFYLDDTLIDTVNAPGLTWNNGVTYIGRGAAGSQLNGWIEDFRITTAVRPETTAPTASLPIGALSASVPTTIEYSEIKLKGAAPNITTTVSPGAHMTELSWSITKSS